MLRLIPCETSNSVVPLAVALIRGQNPGPLRMLGPIRCGISKKIVFPKLTLPAGSNGILRTYVDSGHEDVVAAVLGRVVSAPVAVDAPVARIRRRDAFRARRVRGAVEEGEVGRHEIRSGRHPHRQFGRKVICRKKSKNCFKQKVPPVGLLIQFAYPSTSFDQIATSGVERLRVAPPPCLRAWWGRMGRKGRRPDDQ